MTIEEKATILKEALTEIHNQLNRMTEVGGIDIVLPIHLGLHAVTEGPEYARKFMTHNMIFVKDAVLSLLTILMNNETTSESPTDIPLTLTYKEEE